MTTASLTAPEQFAIHLQLGKKHYIFAIFIGLSTKSKIYEINNAQPYHQVRNSRGQRGNVAPNSQQ